MDIEPTHDWPTAPLIISVTSTVPLAGVSRGGPKSELETHPRVTGTVAALPGEFASGQLCSLTRYTVTTNPTDPRPDKTRLPNSKDAPSLYTTSSVVGAFHPGN